MTSKYSVRIVQYGQAQPAIDLQARAGKEGKALVLQAQSGMRFQLLETLNQTAPTRLRIARKGADLLLTLPDGDPSAPDLVIKGYFDAQDVSVMGRSTSGEWRVSDNTSWSSSSLANGINAASMADGQASVAGLSTPAGDGWFEGEKGWLWLGAGTLGLVAAAAGGGGGKSETSEPTAFEKIRAFANRTPNAATPTVSDYANAGIQQVDANNVAAVNSALTTTPLDMSAQHNIQRVVDSFNLILGEANGSAADATPGSDPTADDYQNLGVLLGSQQTNSNGLALLNDVIKGLVSESGDSVTELRAIVAAVNKVMTIAAGVTPASALTTDDLQLMGFSQQQLDAVHAKDNLTSIVSAIGATSDDGSDVSSVAQLQTLMAAYDKILTEANGSTPDADVTGNPTAADFAALGSNIGQAATSASALTMLVDVVGGLQRADVDTVAEINAIAATLDKVAAIAARPTGDTAMTLSAVELSRLGLSGLSSTGANNQNVADLLSVAIRDSEPADVDTLAELQTLVSLQVLRVWASDSAVTKTAALPTAEDYVRIGVRRDDTAGVAVPLSASDVTTLNSFVDNLTDAKLDALGEIQQLGAALFRVLNEANGTAADGNTAINPAADDYVALGVSGHAGSAADALHTSAARLLTDVVSTKTTTQVDTPAELNSLAASVDHVMDVAGGAPVAALTLNDLSSLGITGATTTNLTVVANSIQATADDGSAVDTLAELQTLVNSVRNAGFLGTPGAVEQDGDVRAILAQVTELTAIGEFGGPVNGNTPAVATSVALDVRPADVPHQSAHGESPALAFEQMNQVQAFANATQVILS